MSRPGVLAGAIRRYAIAVLICSLGLGLRAASPADQQKLASANIGFAFKLLQQLLREQPGTNVFISPFCASSVLQMICQGAEGHTKGELQAVLGTTSLQPDTLNDSIKEIGKSLNSRGTNIQLTAANALWYRKGTPLKADFIACNQQFFGATVDALDFDDPRSVGIINAWAREKTHGKIDGIAEGIIPPSTELFLANAVYFKGKWEVPFDTKATQERAFHLRNGRQKRLPMMEQTRKFTYRRGTGYQAVRLGYQGWSLGMYVFLPDNGSSPEKLLGIMNGDTWQRVTEPGFSDRDGTVVLPRFKLEYRVELMRSLKALGIKAAFGNADFSGISARPLFISASCQRTLIELDEKGTEAAAVTGIPVPIVGIEMNPPKPFQMIVDRPFLFLIGDKETRTILFMGVVFDPDLSP